MSPGGGGRYSHLQTVTFTPASLAGLVGWWDASNAASLTGSPGVSQWNDLSGRGAHWVQATPGSQFATGTRTQNGLNALDVANNQFMTCSGISEQPTVRYYWCVFQADDVTTQNGEPMFFTA